MWYSNDDGRIGVRFTTDSPDWDSNVMPLTIGCEDAAAVTFVNANKCPDF
jgi:hypothetical protein